MSDSIRFHAAVGERPFWLSSLVLLTGLTLTLQTPLSQDATVDLFAGMERPTLAHTLELWPGNPPPWMEGDQMMTEEMEELPLPVSADRDAAQSAMALRERMAR
ncbi:hypothetical protein SAMN05421693_101137 [Ectothiorhodospira magna]|uniref:Uncharacterized protein n=1 Tax=Ectothiorhodospira magna TaxID=867345 RepID=A0A1H8Z1X8_9GAMM|nr:hypothetical protein [Ectothiorhodospira magna]SEP58351.1 hypothetical protein SAMN05421693_101137 [Ectothiorhodospira magna]